MNTPETDIYLSRNSFAKCKNGIVFVSQEQLTAVLHSISALSIGVFEEGFNLIVGLRDLMDGEEIDFFDAIDISSGREDND